MVISNVKTGTKKNLFKDFGASSLKFARESQTLGNQGWPRINPQIQEKSYVLFIETI